MNESYVGRPVPPSAQKVVDPSAPRSERCTWHDEPSRSLYLAMKVSDWPWLAAICLAAVL